MSVKGAAPRSKSVDIWRVNVIYPETLELRPEVVDTNQQYIRPLFSNREKRQQPHQNKNEFTHIVPRLWLEQPRLQLLEGSFKTFLN